MPKISRRTFLRIALRGALSAGAAGLGAASYGALAEPGWLSVEQVDAPLRGLPPAMAGLRIAHLSDLHAGPLVSEAMLTSAVAATMAARPELVVITGDFVSGPIANLAGATRALTALRAPLGVYAVLGNHDHWTGQPDQVAAQLEAAGVRVLRNQSGRVATPGGDLWLAGVDDVLVGRPDLGAALRGAPPGAPLILLAHEPDYADYAARRGVALQLSGHTHGGQVRLPLLGAPLLPRLGRRYPIGLQRVAGQPAYVYTSRGVGMSSPGIRIGCRPEVALLRLLPG